MNNQTKRGFSLVEVMILFTVLAVAMAAALPLITKKSKPVPAKATHGVYRCIATENGNYLEETYNSFRRLKSNYVGECTFKVPNASVYKIDLFSAGAGGTLYASYNPQQNDNRFSTFGMEDAEIYARTGKIAFSNSQAEEKTDMPYDLTDDDVRLAFRNEHIITTAYSTDAGTGGSSTYYYRSPANTLCSAVVSGRSVANNKVKNAESNLEAKTKDYEDRYNAYDKKIEEYNKKIKSDTEKKAKNNETIERYTKHQTTLSNYSSAMSGLSTGYNTLASSSAAASNKAKAYDNIVAAATKTASSGYSLNSVYNTTPMTYSPETGYPVTYTGLTTPIGTINDRISTVKSWFTNEANHTRDIYDEEGVKTGTRNATTDEKIEDLVGSTTNMNILKEIASLGTTASNRAESYIATLQGYIDKLKEENGKLDAEIKRIQNTDIPNVNKERENDKNLANAKTAMDQASKDLQDRKNVYNAMLKGYVDEDARPSVYNGATDYKFDTSEDDFWVPQTSQQISEYCKNQEEYAEYYKPGNDYGWNESQMAFEHTGSSEHKTQSGGVSGKGKRMKLEYILYEGGNDLNRYKTANQYAAYRQYPFIKYIGDLYGNVANQGYEAVSCTSLTLNSTNCKSARNAVLLSDSIGFSADSGKSQTSDANDRKPMETSGSKKILRADSGKNVEKFMAYHVPDFNGGVGSYVTLQKKTTTVNGSDVAATGGKGAVVGYTERNKKFTGTNFNENLAWQMFVGEGTTANSLYAQGGEDAVLSGSKSVANRYTLTQQTDREAQQPRLTQEAKLWSKIYSMGQNGTPGKHIHFQVSSMGTQCSLTIPHGGQVFDYMRLSKAAEAEHMELAKYFAKIKKEYEEDLAASITCADSDGNEVFTRRVDGGTYNTSPSPWKSPFYWYKNPSDHSVSAMLGEAVNASILSSRWSKVLHSMTDLSSFGVSNAGKGTGLTDSCNSPKGEYHFNTYRMNSKNGGAWEETKLSGLHKSYDTTFDGKKGGFDCYKDDRGEGSYSGVRIFDNSASGNMTSEDRAYYTIDSPTSGGGGAIVIAW